tara:strand:+ start:622 stop:735 length:114 start_codon:yes stop_codon:yes gene_type:complete
VQRNASKELDLVLKDEVQTETIFLASNLLRENAIIEA